MTLQEVIAEMDELAITGPVPLRMERWLAALKAEAESRERSCETCGEPIYPEAGCACDDEAEKGMERMGFKPMERAKHLCHRCAYYATCDDIYRYTTQCVNFKNKEETMEKWQERVIPEKNELDDKIGKLLRFIEGNEHVKTVDNEELYRLKEQRDHMLKYSEVLADRIRAFKPVKTIKPWTFETCPREGWWRFKNSPNDIRRITQIDNLDGGHIDNQGWVTLLECCEYSPNGVDGWTVCGVEVEG